MYPSLDEARRAVEMAGDAIRTKGLPAALCPFTVVFTGSGKVTNGALDIFKLLPHEMVAPASLQGICAGHSDNHKLYLAIATAEDMVRRTGGGHFDKAEYYAEPERYEPIFKNTVLPYSNVIVNGMYWDQRFPKLFTHEDLHEQVVAGHDRLLGVCDITCDADGSVPTRQFTSIEQPFYVFNALTEKVSTCLDEHGVLFHAVDHLPSELPREASEHFGDSLLRFLPDLVYARGSQQLPVQIRGAIIAEEGKLTRDFQYIEQLRSLSQVDSEDAGASSIAAGAVHAHGVQCPPACVTLELTGHLFDSKTINRVVDLVEAAKARLHILKIDVGTTVRDESFLSILLMAQTEEHLGKVEAQIRELAAEAQVTLRRSGQSSQDKEEEQQEAGPNREILVLGAGFVSAPVVEYLLRRPENSLTVASIVQNEVEALAKRFGSRVRPKVVDITATTEESLVATEVLVCAADLVVSLVMMRTVRDYHERTAYKVGFKPAGGIRDAKTALSYMMLFYEELGEEWTYPHLCRIGASSLLSDIELQVEHGVTGRYSAKYYHPAP
jgi:alpha-aminoadipic semialdehyde synthase